ncbi:RNA recognition motif domain-containing protein [Cyclospora cayetanensis]|uniref:RNA recognition motif domain-containing protein n=1 Tax=Cyclospora cayetanensis TaxID=88456 RepID=A0A1D3DA78_9EIME|nr:RNA recognition motif domain-containing protein [Cyclospora cayetanensis]
MDCVPVDRAFAGHATAPTSVHSPVIAVSNMQSKYPVCQQGSSWTPEEEYTKPQPKVEQRSILVRDLPGHLAADEATEVLRQLFSNSYRQPGHCLPKKGPSHGAPPPVPARQGALPQSSWLNNRRYATEGTIEDSKRENQRNHALQQLPYAMSSIRIAADTRGASLYAIVDFTHEVHAKLALELLGSASVLPGTSSQVRLSLHETWSTPLVVDEYHVYISGLAPGATADQVEDLVTAATQIVPTHVKMSSVAGLPSRKGVREYAFLRYSDEDVAEIALKRLQEASPKLNIIVRKVYQHQRRGIPTEPLTHAANCSIFIANLPPLTNSEELREICSYFHVVRAAEVHPTRNFGFVRLASHEAALAAISHLNGMKLHGRTMACAWSSRCLTSNVEETLDDAWERAEEAYAVMSAQCMEYEAQPAQQSLPSGVDEARAVLSPKTAARRAAVEAAGQTFWFSVLAENGPVTISDIASRMRQRQRKLRDRLEHWQAQDWEEDTESTELQSTVPRTGEQ